MAVFIISCGIQILSFFFALFGLSHENLIKNRKFIPVIRWVTGGLFTGAFIIAAIEAYNSSSKADRQYGMIYADSIQLVEFRTENRTLNDTHSIALAKHDINTIEILAKYGLKVDTLSGTIEKINASIVKELPPTLAILQVPTIKTTNNEKNLIIDLYSLNSDSHILDFKIITINVKKFNGDISVYKKTAIFDTPHVSPSRCINFTTIVPSAKQDGVPIPTNESMWFLDRNPNLKDTFILAVEAIYKSKGNKIQTPLRKVYVVYKNQSNVQEVDSYLFEEMALILKKHKIWRKFYNL